MDYVHVGDRNGVKGVYDINLIDPDRLRSAVTQFEHVGAVTGIAETFLVPVLEEMLVTLPFVVVGFHADNASRRDAPVPSTSTARSRRCSTSCTCRTSRSRGRGAPTTTPWSMPAVPAGCKNASVVRKWLGHDHIPQRFAPAVNADRLRSAFAQGVLTPYLSHHHPCLFATEVRDGRGEVRRRYRRRDVATPYEKLKSLPDAERFLKPGVTFADLDEIAYAVSDLEANRRANRARDELFRTIGQAVPTAA